MKIYTRIFKFFLAISLASSPILGCNEPPPVPQKDAKDLNDKAGTKKPVRPGPASPNATDK